MLNSFSHFDLFNELMNRGQYRAVAAMFIDIACSADLTLSLPQDDDANLSEAMTECHEEMSAMWNLAMLKIDASHQSDDLDSPSDLEVLRSLLEFTVAHKASQSDRQREFYHDVIDSAIPVVSPLPLDTVAWFTGA